MLSVASAVGFGPPRVILSRRLRRHRPVKRSPVRRCEYITDLGSCRGAWVEKSLPDENEVSEALLDVVEAFGALADGGRMRLPRSYPHSFFRSRILTHSNLVVITDHGSSAGFASGPRGARGGAAPGPRS